MSRGNHGANPSTVFQYRRSERTHKKFANNNLRYDMNYALSSIYSELNNKKEMGSSVCRIRNPIPTQSGLYE